MTLTVSKVFNLLAALFFVLAGIAGGLVMSVSMLALLALALWQIAEATK